MPSSTDEMRAHEPAATGSALREAKRSMRVRLMAVRDALDPDFRAEASRAIVQRIFALDAVTHANVLLVTLPFRSEWDSTPLVLRALRADRRVAVPRVDTPSRMLHLHEVHDLAADIAVGPKGVPEPRPSCRRVSPSSVDVVIVPGVAFDAEGGRLGYGGGFYDRLLPLLRPDVPRIAAGFDEQIVDRVPCSPYDVRIDAIVTPTRTLRVPR
jgi:5-formyltetrahydrofolate cyclo-ligase